MLVEVLALVVIAVAAGAIGLWLGIVILAPRLRRRVEPSDEEPDDRGA